MLDMPVHDRRRRAQAETVRRPYDVEPLRRVDLVRADDGAHLIVQDLRGGARQGAQAGGLELSQKRPDRHAQRRRALRDLQWREGVNMHVRDRRLDGAANAEIGLAGVIRMDAALQADLGRASLPRLDRAAHDFLEREVIRRAAQRLMRLALGEGAELAAVGAYVGIVDVAVDDIADDVAACRPAKLIGRGDDPAVVGVARREQPHDLRLIQAVAGLSALDDALDRRIDRARMDRRRPRSALRARRPIVVAREALGVAQTAHLRGDLRRRPGRQVARVRGIDRQAMHQELAGRGRALGKLRDRRPRRLRIDVIRSDGRDPAPIIDPGRNQPRIDARR